MNTSPSVRPDRPLVPGDLDPSRALTRAMTAHVLREIRGPMHGSAEDIVAKAWPRDLLARAAVNPIGTAGAAALQPVAVAGFVSGLAPLGAAAKLMQEGIKVDLEGNGTITLPRAATNPGPVFVDEGAPAPVAQAVIANATCGPMKKMLLLDSVTAELAEMSIPNAELVVRTIMNEAAAKALDSAVFSTAPSSSSRPAGILAGAPLTATAGGGQAAFAADIATLLEALTAAGGGTRVMFFAPPAKAAMFGIYAARFAFEVIPTPALSAARVVCLDPSAFAYAFGADPQIDVSTESTIHYEDATPAQIGVAGSPNVVAAPVRNLYQTRSFALRLRLPCAWTMRAPVLAHVNSATW